VALVVIAALALAVSVIFHLFHTSQV